jgi:hypothetical protein
MSRRARSEAPAPDAMLDLVCEGVVEALSRWPQAGPVAQRDWEEWHRDYDDPGSLLSGRLELVQGHLRAELDNAPVGDIRR